MNQEFSRPTIIADKISCQRGGRMLFDGLDFSLAPGELIVLTGPNGSGKSTLLRMLAGLTPIDTGNVRLEGQGEESEPGAHMHFHGHHDGLRDALTPLENLAFSVALAGNAGLDPMAALERMGAKRLADLPTRVLSAGQRRRVALARLLAARRPIWLLDEPLTALDVAGQALVSEIVRDHVEGGGSAIVATHQPMDVAARSLTLGAAK